jgi:hypothetical protein
LKLIVIFGPPAVGKMSVGAELASRTGLLLFHNHVAIEPALKLFPFGSLPFIRLVRTFRNQVFHEVAQSDSPGMIYTFLWNLSDERDKQYIDEVTSLFRSHGADVFYVELYSPLEVRLERNRTEERLREKPSKRDVGASEQRLLGNEKHRLNSDGDFFYPEQHLRIDNTDLSAREAAEQIIDRFQVRRTESS